MQRRTLTLGHSPDPDDAFMFYALAAGKIDARGWSFEHVLQDIQTLNERATRGELDITAISIHAYPFVADRYALLSCGASMGDGYGPMVVAREAMGIEELRRKTIAVPGEKTTAFLALNLLLREPSRSASAIEAQRPPGPFDSEPFGGEPLRAELLRAEPLRAELLKPAARGFRHEVVMFDRILDHVASGRADAGLIIHEGQLTYQRHKLHLVVDLGEWWKRTTGLPLPLGGNVIRRDLGAASCVEIDGILRASIEYGLAHRADAVEHAMKYARDMGRDLADRFVGLYVNDWTLDYGPTGRRAITELLRRGHEIGLVPNIAEPDFVSPA